MVNEGIYKRLQKVSYLLLSTTFTKHDKEVFIYGRGQVDTNMKAEKLCDLYGYDYSRPTDWDFIDA